MNLLSKLQNEDSLRKAFETGDFKSSDGLLNADQQDRFIVLLKRFNVLMGATRVERMRHSVKDLDKLHIAEPITRGVAENSLSPTPVKPKSNKVTLVAKKLISNWDITTETLQDNIEQANFEDTLMTNLIQRIGVDLEQLAINGDESLTLLSTNPSSLLLSSNDGWYKQSLDSHVIDLEGDSISRGLFSAMLREMPKQYRSDPGLRFIMSDTLVIDWLDLLSGGNSFAADAGAIGAEQVAAQAFASMMPGLSPYGKPIVRAPLIPDDQPVSTGSGASYAFVNGTNYGPFAIMPGVNDTLIVSVDGGPATPITFTASAGGEIKDLTAIVSELNAVLEGLGGLALDNGEGQLMIRSLTDGAASSLDISAEASGSTANVYFGFAKAGESSVGLDTAGTVDEGTFMWLVNPQNLVWGILDGTRVFTEFNKDYDRIETVVYNQVDFKILNPDAMVLATGIRKRSLI